MSSSLRTLRTAACARSAIRAVGQRAVVARQLSTAAATEAPDASEEAVRDPIMDRLWGTGGNRSFAADQNPLAGIPRVDVPARSLFQAAMSSPEMAIPQFSAAPAQYHQEQ